MKVTLTTITPDAENLIARCAGICYDADTGPDANARRVRKLMNLKHLATLRFAQAVFHVEGISRVCSHQIVRHPHLSFLQRSQRYTNESEQSFIVPEAIAGNETLRAQWGKVLSNARETYDESIRQGARKEDARFILPQSCTTEMYIAGNFQAWFDFLKRRLDKHAQWEVRDVAQRVCGILNANAPNIFNPETLHI